MRSLFEKEEKEIALNQLKLDLISRFYPFSKDEILQYKSILNFDRYHLMNNDSVKCDIELLDKVDEKIDWSALWKIKNIKFDLAFFKKYESKIKFKIPNVRLSNLDLMLLVNRKMYATVRTKRFQLLNLVKSINSLTGISK